MAHRLLLLATVLTLVLAAPAAAGTLKPFSDSWVRADGSRWAAWAGDGGNFFVADERRGIKRSFTAPAGCLPGAVGSARVALGCSNDDTHWVVLSALDGSMLSSFNAEPPSAGPVSAHAVALGDRRLAVDAVFYHGAGAFVVDWRTSGQTSTDDFPATNVPALDGAAPSRPLCSPLHRWPAEHSEVYYRGPDYSDYQYVRPWGVTARGERDDQRLDNAPLSYYLERCGTTKARVLCKACVRRPQLGTAYVSWIESDRVAVLRLRDAHRFVFKGAAATNASAGVIDASVAGRRLFVVRRGVAPTTVVATLPR